MQNLFDAHCHLQDERLYYIVADILSRAAELHVTRMMCCGTQESDWERVLALTGAHNEIKASLGVHPWFADKAEDGWQNRLRTLLHENQYAAVGEIGLDFALDTFTQNRQESVLLEQLAIAREFNRPVSLHCRRAFGRLAKILTDEGGVPQGGVLHSYSGSADMVPVFEKHGLYISFSGSITYIDHKRAHASAAVVSANRLLIETDSPDIQPAEAAVETNEPANLIHVAQALARIRQCSSSSIAQQTTANALNVFSCAFSS